jgi:hypothetical protein
MPGGPLYPRFRRARLADDPLKLLRRRVEATTLLSRLPLLVEEAVRCQALFSPGIEPKSNCGRQPVRPASLLVRASFLENIGKAPGHLANRHVSAFGAKHSSSPVLGTTEAVR